MRKYLSFIKMEILTTKPHMTLRTLLIFVLTSGILLAVTGMESIVLVVAAMLSKTMLEYTFMSGERDRLDMLYVTLSISRTVVVRGRYLFALLHYFATTTAALLLVSLYGLVTQGAGYLSELVLTASLALPIISLFLVFDSLGFPIYFKFGYEKAVKYAMIVPMVAFAAIFARRIISGEPITMPHMSDLPEVNPFAVFVAGAAMFVLACALRLASYMLSLLFYKRREF
jgi:hypothetical protein